MSAATSGAGAPGRAACACLASLCAFQSIANERQPFPKIDPYTHGEPAAISRAGYASLGPFTWGDDHTTRHVEAALGGVPLIWVETEHFKLGSGLAEYRITASSEREKLREELARLDPRLPEVEKGAKRLDPWLRLHLNAARLEALYARFCAELGLTEADFEAQRFDDLPTGPHLGMRGKTCVLMFQEASALDRYCRTFLGCSETNAISAFFRDADSRMLAIAAESYRELESVDTALHFGLVYQVVMELETGFRSVHRHGPEWWRQGLARWFAREVDPNLLLFATPGGAPLRPVADSRWQLKVRARVEAGEFPPTAEMLDWKATNEWSFADHMIAWSRVDFLLSGDAGAARRYFHELHEPVPWSAEYEQRVAAQVRGALASATGLAPADFDAAWRRYVLESYEKR